MDLNSSVSRKPLVFLSPRRYTDDKEILLQTSQVDAILTQA
jgi:hypothetical protein